MERKEFLNKVSEELINMSEQKKDAWILNCARLISEYKQEDFIQCVVKHLALAMGSVNQRDI